MLMNIYQLEIERKMKLLAFNFEKVLYKDDQYFMEGMKSKNLAGDDASKYRYWEWTQGVGLYGLWKVYQLTGDTNYRQLLENYYEQRFAEGLPSKNINTIAPMLTLAFLNEELDDSRYHQELIAWCHWVMYELPRTKEGGFQHITSDSINEEELWDDTLFMTVLFLAKMGVTLNETSYVEEAKYQFMVHAKYLVDRNSGLWYHGWTFLGHHNFVGGLWGRGNCWVTLAIPEMLEIIQAEESFERYLKELFIQQVDTLVKTQNNNGMWHTLIDDASSYVEASATCGFACGILSGIRLGLIDHTYLETAMKALTPIIDLIDKDGMLNQVSYGTPMGREDLDFYKNIPIEPMPYGQALGIMFLSEVLKLDIKLEKSEA